MQQVRTETVPSKLKQNEIITPVTLDATNAILFLSKGEERRQEMIAKQNHELLLRILNIMASPSRIDTWNVSYMNK